MPPAGTHLPVIPLVFENFDRCEKEAEQYLFQLSKRSKDEDGHADLTSGVIGRDVLQCSFEIVTPE